MSFALFFFFPSIEQFFKRFLGNISTLPFQTSAAARSLLPSLEISAGKGYPRLCPVPLPKQRLLGAELGLSPMWCICLEKIIQVLNSLFRTAFHPRVAGEKRKALHEVAVMAAACLRGVFGGKGNRKQSSGLGLPLNLNLAPKNPSRVSDSKPMLRITL